MVASSAVTINRSQEEILTRLAEAEPPLSDAVAQISYAPAPGNDEAWIDLAPLDPFKHK
jgi:hypothetical protein